MTFEPRNFFLRLGGSDPRFFRLQALEDLSQADQLLCALVRNDASVATTILCSDARNWLLPFLGLLQDNSLASLSLHHLYSAGLIDHARKAALPDQPVDSEDVITEGVWSQNSLAVNLQRMSSSETARYDDFDEKLSFVLDAFSPLSDHIVWPKGISLSRTIYPEPSTRLSADFDCILPKEHAGAFFDACIKAGYVPHTGDPGFCNQLQVGPCDDFVGLFSVPSPDAIPSAVIGFKKRRWPLIDPKFNPTDRGLLFREVDRFYADAVWVKWRRVKFKAPSLIDHLIICLVHAEKDRFLSFRSLIDIHMLAEAVNKEGGWNEFARRVILEGLKLSTWAGLAIAVDRFGSSVPSALLAEIAPERRTLSKHFTFTVEPLFYWNCSSILTLFLNAWFTGDRSRKLETLRQSFFPGSSFLSIYYAGGRKINRFEQACLLLLHLIVFLGPAALVRRTFGGSLWPRERQYCRLIRDANALSPHVS